MTSKSRPVPHAFIIRFGSRQIDCGDTAYQEVLRHIEVACAILLELKLRL